MSSYLQNNVRTLCAVNPELVQHLPGRKPNRPFDYSNLSADECRTFLDKHGKATEPTTPPTVEPPPPAKPAESEHRFPITPEASITAPLGDEEEITIEQLCEMARLTKKPTKAELPLFVAATFPPEDRSAEARTNANVIVCTAIVGDYDKAEMTLVEAEECLRKANVHGAIISSPRHNVPVTKRDGTTTCGPRWRVICPLAKPVVAVEHQKYAERLNGVFGQDVLGTEGESESRAWYIGSLAGEPDCERHIVPGRFIDLADDIEGLPFPAAKSHITLPDIPVDVDAEAAAEMVLTAATQFEGGHEGMKQAANLLAPYCLIGALDSEAVAQRLQARLEDTSSRGASVPHNEAAKVLKWSLQSNVAQSKTRSIRDAIMLDKISTEEGVRRLLNGMIPKAKAEDEFDAVDKPTDDEVRTESAGDTKNETPTDKPAKPNRFLSKFLSLSQLDALPDPEWLIEGLLPAASFAVIYGQPKSGKTFLAVSAALHIAAGKPWMGREVKQGPVVYIAAEGASGLKLRTAAMRQHYSLPDDLPFHVLPCSVQFGEAEQVRELIAAIRAITKNQAPALIVVDTLNRAMAGRDENSSKDMSVFVEACDSVKEAFGCTVLPIHHSGKDTAKGMRGSNALDGAVDTALEVVKPSERQAELRNTYQKEAAPAEPIAFDMRIVDVGERSSLVPTLATGGAAKPAKEIRGKVATTLGELDMLLRNAKPLPDGPRFPRNVCGVLESEWQQNALGRMPADMERKHKQQQFRRHRDALVDMKVVECFDGWAWRTDDARSAEADFEPVDGNDMGELLGARD